MQDGNTSWSQWAVKIVQKIKEEMKLLCKWVETPQFFMEELNEERDVGKIKTHEIYRGN